VVRTIPRGGFELTEKLADKLDVDFATAEAAKLEVGLTGERADVAKVLNELVRPLLAELRSSIHYFGSTNSSSSLERISLTGGAAGLRGFAEMLAEQMAVSTSVVTPMQHIRNRWSNNDEHAESPEGSASAVSIGLAMGAAA
jgi:type IV pilus assembly protein PilM